MPDYGISFPEQTQDSLIIDPIESGLKSDLIPQPVNGGSEPEKPNQGDLVESVQLSDTSIVELTGLATTDIIPLDGLDIAATESKLVSDDGAEHDPITGVTTGDELKGITDEIGNEPLINPVSSDDAEEVPAASLGGELEPQKEAIELLINPVSSDDAEEVPAVILDSELPPPPEATDSGVSSDLEVEKAATEIQPAGDASGSDESAKLEASSPVENAATTTDKVVSGNVTDPAKLEVSSPVENAATTTDKVVSGNVTDPAKLEVSSPVENAATTTDKVVSGNVTTDTKIETKPDPTKSGTQLQGESATNNNSVIATDIPAKNLATTSNFNQVKPIFESGTFKVDSTGQVGLDYIFDGGGFQGQLAIISLSGMAEFEPGSAAFLKEAARRALSGSEEGHIVIDDVNEGAKFSGYLGEGNQNFGSYQGVKTFAMRPGDTFGVMLIPNGTVQEVFNNPAVGGNKRPLFSMVTANPNLAFHLGQIADVTGEGNTFVMEDLRADNTRFDRDYNDIIFQVRGAVGKAVLMDDVVATGRDWRKSDLGKGLIAYAKTYVNPEPIEEVEAVTEPESPASTEPVAGISDKPTTEPTPTTGTGTDVVSDKPTTEPTPTTGTGTDVIGDETTPTTGTGTDVISEQPTTEPETGTGTDVIGDVIDDETTPTTGTGTDVIGDVIEDETTPTTGTGTNVIDDETTPTTGTGTDVIDDETTPTTGTGTDVISEQPTTEPETGTGTDVIGDETTPTTGTGTDVIGDETTTEPTPTTGTGTDVISDETTPTTGTGTDVISDEPTPTTGTGTDVISEQPTTEPETGTGTDVISEQPTTEPETGTGTDVISEQPTTEPETGTGTDVIDDETTTEPTTGTGSDVIDDETTPEPETGTGTDVIGDKPTTEPITGTGTDVIGDKPTTEPTTGIGTDVVSDKPTTEPKIGTGTDVVSDKPTTEPKIGTGTDVVSEQPNQPNNPDPVNEKPVEIIDILTGEKITPPPSPSIPELQISQPQGSKNQPITGTIAPKDNQPQNWASSLVEFVDTAVKSGQSNAVININIDFTKIQTGSDTSPLQLTTEEKAALEYAQENNVLVVVPVGDTPGQLSAIAQVSKEFDNIITVGAAQRVNNAVAVSKAFAPLPNSGSGSNLDIMAEGTNGDASGTTVAAAKATEAMAKVWAANPKLDYTQVIDIVKRTATDLALPNWDAATGAGMVNTEAAVWLAKVTQPVVKETISLVPVADVELTPAQPTTNIDLSKVLVGKNVTYEIVGGASDAVAVKLTGSELQLSGLAKSGLTDVTIRATDAKGKSVETKFSVTNYYLEPTSVSAANTALTELTTAINSIPGDLITALSGDAAAAHLENLLGVVEENPQLVQLLAKPEILAQLGMDSSGLATLQQLLNSPELAQELGLKGTVAEALSNPDSTALDSFLLNADEAVALLPENAKQPKVGFIDFTQGNHIQQVTNTFASVNPLAQYDSFNVTGGNWAAQLVKFVDKVKRAGETHAIANLSFDLSQLDDIGITTRYELTPAEQQAIQYARDNNVLLVVASGNTGNVMSALGQASQKFDNIITVGAVNQFQSKTDYSAYGKGLTLMAPGGTWQDDAGAFVGTSRATAYVSAAASLVWAANPELSFQQVKQLLIDTAADLDVEGWDVLTGAGLVDIKEALDRATFIEGQGATTGGLPLQVNPFSGEGRVKTLARPAGDKTEQAIIDLDNIQQTLLEQWQVLADLGNPALTLGELDAEVQAKIAEAFKTYQQVSTDAEITTAQAQQWAEALALATQHYQIEQGRLLALQARQKELEEQLAGLGQQKTALEAETQQLLDGIKKDIAKAEEDLAKSQAKLANPFANADDSLQFNSQSFWNAAANQQQLAQNFRQQAGALAGESQHYQAVANSINPNRWQVVGSSSSLSGRSKEVWGWGQNPQLVKQKNQYQWLAGITALNSQILQQLATQTDQQGAALQQYGNLLENRKNTLNLGSGSTDDAATVLQLLQEQAAQQQALANNYAQQAAIAEKRRRESQANADWHNSLINRWEVVGTRRTGKSGRNVENVYGWRHYPEHIAPRDRAQQLAWQAAGERQTYDQLAQQAQQQASALAEQARKLQERLRDWPVLKQGIEYEIAADSLRLQAEQDLLAMHEPVQEQKLETLNLQISQTEEELQTLTGEKLPAQQQLTDATEQRLQETQSEVEAIQQEREAAKKDLQNFLETAGFLLPYRERLAAVEKTIQQLEDDKLKVQETMQALTVALLQTPSETLRQQLNHWGNYVETLEQELDWAKLQKDQLALALTDSPERLAISGLIKELEAEKGTAVADDVPLQRYIDFLRGIEGSGANFLEGFDNLEQRLAAAQTEQKDAEKALKQLQDEYRNLGLQKSNLEDKLIPAKEQEIKTTQENIAATETTLANLQTELTGLQDAQAQKAIEVANQEAVVATTQAQTQAEIANIQTQINAKDAQIQQQQAVANSYQNQINQASANAGGYENERSIHQWWANYWSHRSNYFAIYWNNLHQNSANIFTQYRNAANEQVKQLTADFNTTNDQIKTLNKEKADLIQQQQAQRDKLAAEQATMQRLQQELQAISQQINTLQANIQQQEQKLDGLNNLLAQQQQQLADLQAQIPRLEQQLIDKYRQIELTENYLSQVEAEVNRLDARLDLLNRAGILEQQYQDNWQKWQQASLAQTQATEALIATRQAGENDRTLLASLQSKLTQAQTNLQTAQTLQQNITDTLQAVEFSKLQLGNQRLLLQSLIDRENSLAALERYYLNLAEQHRQRIWATGGYNAGEAAAYRSNLEQASFIADLWNKLGQQRQETQQKINQLNQQISQQQSQIATQKSQLAALGGIAQVQARITQINADIDAVNQRLQPLENLEKEQTEAITNAGSLTEHLTSELVQTAQLQATALRQLIGFGILASESDVDFFLTQVEPNVNSAIKKLREREQELTAQVQSAASRTATAEQELANTTDAVSKQALTNLIAQLQGQQSNLEALQAENEKAADELEDLLKQANDSLTPLRQKQELEIRQKLESNDERLQALQSQLNSENAAENAADADTVLAYAQLNDQIRQDLTLNASNWTQQLLDGNQMTKELGTSQQNLSAAVDDLIAYINDNFADPHGEYNRTEADLRDGITTLGVVENRADELDSAFTSTEDAIERIKLRIAQDAALWDEIAPIAIRYGLESQQIAEFTNLAQKLQVAKNKFDQKQPDAIAFATQEVLPIAQSLIDKAKGNPALENYVEKIQKLLEKFNNLGTKQAASEAKAAEVRQEWEDATNYDDTPINQINFGDKLVESRRGQNNLVYVRNSTDGGKTWTQWLHTSGSTNLDSIKTAVVDNKLFQSVRGTDGQVWLRSSSDGVKWANWFPIGGSINGDYSMDVVGKNLVFSIRNSDNKIYSRTAVNGTQWQNWEPVGSTMSDIVQDVVNGKVIQSYRSFDNQIYVRQSADGVKWEIWEKLDAAIAKADWRQQDLKNLQQSDTHSLNPVAQSQYQNKLVEAVRGKDNLIYGRYSSDGGKTWSNWQNTGGQTKENIKMVVASNTLFQVVKDVNNGIDIRQSSDGVNWTGWGLIGGNVAGNFFVDVVDNKLVVSIGNADNKFYSNTLIPNFRWTGWQPGNVNTINEVKQNVVDGKVVQSYKGVDDRTYVRYSPDGLNWKNWETLESAIAKAEINQQYLGEVQQNSDQNPNPVTRTQYKDKLVEAVRGKDNLIYGRYSSDGGKTWSNWQYTNGSINSDVQMVVANNALIQVVKGTDNAVYVRQSNDGINWASWGGISGVIPGGVSVDAIDNKIIFGLRGSDNNFYSRTLIPNVRWTNWEPGQVKTIDGISQKVVDGKVFQTYQGVDGQIYTRSTADGLTWSSWENHNAIAKQYQQEKQAQLPLITQETNLAARPLFLAENYDNGTAIDLLQAATLEGSNPSQQISQQLNAPNANTLLNAPAVEGRNPLQALFDKSKAAQASHEAQGYALLAQANWYQQQAAYHWAHSRKNGPYWYEQRWVKPKCGKGHWETVTHVDHHWIVWQQYSQLFPQLRQQGYAHLVEADKWRKEKERLEPLKNQWIESNDAANEANPVVKEARNFFAELEAARSDIPQAQTQLELLETLLPTLKQQLEEAEAEAAAQNAKVQQEWEDYDTDSEEYRAAVADILQRRGELNKQSIETQQQLAESERWVEQQTVALSAELGGTKTLIADLQQQRQDIQQEILDLVAIGVMADDLDELNTKYSLLGQSLQMLTNKAAVLTAQQTALTQKRTLLTAQNEVILAEQRLLDAYINDPDADTSNLEQQLLDARAALAEAQRLAEQAEAASKALTAPLQDIKTYLLEQNDEHLKAAKEHQQILRALVEATESNANYTLQAAQKQQEVNNLEFQILQRLQQATAAGYQQAKHLLDVAQYNDMATAAELYYRDYKDLASDRGGCAGGAGTAQDAILADQYYREMLNQRELQRRAQAQADAFRVAKETAEAQMNVLQQQQATAQQLLDELNAKVAETQEQREQKQQELAIAQARLDGITRIREQTEQTFTQLVTLEKLNLAQAQLEQEIAQNRQADIDEAVAARQERDQLELERKRLETQARIEQLRQLQAEDDVRQNLNQVRSQLGLATLDATDDPVQLQTQLAGLLTNLQDLQTQQPDLPENVKTLLAEAQGDIHLALQGKEAANIQQNLLNAMDGLVAQIESYKTEINRLDLEEQWDNQLLQTAQSDLQGASQQLLKELDRAAALSGEHDVIDPLYMEMLNKVALADQAVEISQEMAEQSKEILDQIIKQRIAERKARKKAFWNKILGIVSGVIGILGTILSFTPLAPLGIALTAASAGINAIQAAINGDWMGAIFGIVMAGVNALTAGMGNVLSQGTKLAIQGLQSVASGAFNGVRSMMSGDNIMGFLQILGGVAGAVTSGLSSFINQCSSTMQHMVLQVFNSLQNVPTMIYSGIKAIQNGDWFSAIGSFFNSVMTLGGNFAGVFNDTAAKAFEYLSKIGNTGLAIGGAIKDGSIESWLSGINNIINMWGPDVVNLIDRLNGEPIDPVVIEETLSCGG